MSSVAKLSPRAREDLDSFHKQIALENPSAADRVRTAILATADFLACNPEAGNRIQSAPPRHAETRWFVVSRFRNYLLFYQRVESGVIVLRILHAAQDWTRFFPPEKR